MATVKKVNNKSSRVSSHAIQSDKAVEAKWKRWKGKLFYVHKLTIV